MAAKNFKELHRWADAIVMAATFLVGFIAGALFMLALL
jgi:hypothetical protein